MVATPRGGCFSSPGSIDVSFTPSPSRNVDHYVVTCSDDSCGSSDLEKTGGSITVDNGRSYVLYCSAVDIFNRISEPAQVEVPVRNSDGKGKGGGLCRGSNLHLMEALDRAVFGVPALCTHKLLNVLPYQYSCWASLGKYTHCTGTDSTI